MGWLTRKAQNSRVYMCIKEVKWDLEASDSIRRAMIFAIAQLFRVEVLEKEGLSISIFNYPAGHPRERIMRFYEQLEDVRNLGNLQLDQTKKGLERIGIELPNFAISHAKNTTRGLEVWMCILGTGIVPDRQDDVHKIWSLLAASSAMLTEAISKLKKIEEMTNEATGMPTGGMFGNVSDEHWIEACQFVPGIFRT